VATSRSIVVRADPAKPPAGARILDARATPPTPIVNSTARFPALDSLRALFLLLMLYHFHEFEPAMAQATVGQWVYYGVISLGFLGLDVFFALSGFLITGTLLDAKAAPGYFRAFYTRRILRIVPAYALVLVFILIALPHAFGRSSWGLTGGQIASYWTFLTNVAIARHGFDAVVPGAVPLWSIAVEEQFYLFWPIVVYFCGPTRLKQVCLAALVIAPLVRVALLHVLHPASGYVLLPARFDAIASGALLAIWSREPGALDWCKRWSWPVIAITVAFAVTMFCYYGELSPGQRGFQLGVLSLSPYASAALLVLVLTAPPAGRLHGWLTRPVLRHVALYSYGTYLLHAPLAYYLTGVGLLDRDALTRWFGPGVTATIAWGLLLGAISVAAGALSYHLVEAPALRLKRFVPYGTRS